jgi:hypothetical protein
MKEGILKTTAHRLRKRQKMASNGQRTRLKGKNNQLRIAGVLIVVSRDTTNGVVVTGNQTRLFMIRLAKSLLKTA